MLLRVIKIVTAAFRKEKLQWKAEAFSTEVEYIL